MQEIAVSFKVNQFKLSGTLVIPGDAGPYPLVVMIPGSGPIDRDENHARLKINLFRKLAAQFSKVDIATFRYDKIGIGKSEGDYWQCGFYDNVDSAEIALQTVRQNKRINSELCFILGHSEGALIATKLAASSNQTLRGVILLAGTASKGEVILRWQARRMYYESPKWIKRILKCFGINPFISQQKFIAKLRENQKPIMRYKGILKLNAKWLREFLDFDPAHEIPKINIPILAITGTKDIQTPVWELYKMKNMASAPIDIHCIQNLSHLFRIEPTQLTFKKYHAHVKKPIDTETLRIILNWVKAAN